MGNSPLPPLPHQAIFISSPTNIHYLTGFIGSAPTEHEVYLLITSTHVYLFTNSLYLEQANTLKNCYIVEMLNYPEQIKPVQISRDNQISAALKKICIKEKINKIYFEENNLTVREYNELKKNNQAVIWEPRTGNIELLRQIKREDEISHIRTACQITDLAYRHLIKFIKPNVTERELIWQIEAFIRTYNAELAFPPIVAFGTHTSEPHYIPKSQTQLQDHDIIQLDFGAKVHGYCSDMSRVIFMGNPTSKMKKAYHSVLEAQERTIALFQNKKLNYFDSRINSFDGSKMDSFAKSIIKKAGFPPYSHSLGHNIGLDIHESPRLTAKGKSTIIPGMVFSVEPAIYIPNEFGIRIEDTVYLTHNELEVLTNTKKEMIVI